MRISFIGSGRVAQHFAKELFKQHEIVQIYSRNIAHAQTLAKFCNAQGVDDYSLLNNSIDLLIIAISDQAIAEVIQHISLSFDDVLIVHTSGSTHLNVLSQKHKKSGVLYPLQTFSLERDIDWSNTPLFIETTNLQDLDFLKNIANSLSKKVYLYSSEQRLSLHLAAVFACNFTNYCYDMAKQILDDQKVDFSLLHPLIVETANKAIEYDPQTVQTGPAIRKDYNILNIHQMLLQKSGREDLKIIYHLLSQGIQNR